MKDLTEEELLLIKEALDKFLNQGYCDYGENLSLYESVYDKLDLEK
jgi:hypothetical protein